MESTDNRESKKSDCGKDSAVACLVLGILAVLFCFQLITSVIAPLLGIIGLECAGNAKKKGFTGGIRTAGLVLSIIGLTLGGLSLLSFLYTCYIAA